MLARTAPAKLNLALHLLGRRADGYHRLDSLVTFADVGDRVMLSASQGWALKVDGPCAAGVPTDARNLVTRAARLAAETLRRPLECAVHLHKALPHGAGLGGGSMDAAAVLHLLRAHWALTEAEWNQVTQAALALGADMPMALRAEEGWLRMRGVGEQVDSLPALCTAPLHAVLTHAGEALGTPEVYAACLPEDFRPALPEVLPRFTNAADNAVWLKQETQNGLEPAARRINASIAPQMMALEAAEQCLLARMTGSGSACFGLFAEEETAAAAAQKISATHPHWWVRATALGTLQKEAA